MFCVGLDNAKTPVNIGHALRACHAYGASMLAVSGSRGIRSATDVTAAYNTIPVVRCSEIHAVIPFGCVPVAVELHPNAESLITFHHPRNAIYIFGAEDNTLGHRVLSYCKHIVYVPTAICMNLSACVNVVLYDRAAKASNPNADVAPAPGAHVQRLVSQPEQEVNRG